MPTSISVNTGGGRYVVRGLTVLAILIAPWLCLSDAGASMDIRSSPASRLDFSLLLQQNNLVLANAEHSLETDFSGFGFQAVDMPPDLPIQIGLGGGYAFVNQTTVSGLNGANPDNTTLNNDNMGGYYFSLLARTGLFTNEHWSSQAVFTYEYLAVERNGETQNSRLHWNHFTAEANLDYFLSYYFSVRLGAVYGSLKAKLSGSGDNNVNISLDTDEQFAAYVGVDYHLPEDQKVTLTLQQGYNNRIVIQFQRTFY